MNKEQERERLHDLVFDGAPDDFKWAARDWNNDWFLYKNKPVYDSASDQQWCHTDVHTSVFKPCVMSKNQPETELDWADTLIWRRS